MTAQSRPIVIGVDGSAAVAGVVRYGVEEARRVGAPIKLIHVVPDYVPVSPMVPLTPVDLVETGTALLAAAEQQVRELAPDLHVEAWLHHGTRPVQLVQAAEGARFLAVGRDDRPLMERLLRGDGPDRRRPRRLDTRPGARGRAGGRQVPDPRHRAAG